MSVRQIQICPFITLSARYLELIKLSSISNPKIIQVHQLLTVGLENVNTFPIDKLYRWLGFAQGVLSAFDMIDVNTERDISRPLFHTMYQQLDIEIPISVDVSNPNL
jgi:hypothetical protein